MAVVQVQVQPPRLSLFPHHGSGPPSPLRAKCSHIVHLPDWELGNLWIQTREAERSRIMGCTVSVKKGCIHRGLESRAGLHILALSSKTPGRGLRAGGFQQPSNHITARSPHFMSAWSCLQRVHERVRRGAWENLSSDGDPCEDAPESLRSL